MPRFVLNETSYHGAGAIENIVPEIKARDFKKIFVCSDPDLVKFGVTQKVTSLLCYLPQYLAFNYSNYLRKAPASMLD